ncbi:MAG: amylo-alpha-1,6-glucosidase [Fimbriimonas sp.]|nr:amylo-alpha-1,6-glucosidase [Fimbriimonas sp.]
MRYVLDERQCQNIDLSSRREWLLTNGIGGYSMGTAAGINTRRYHGLLVAATTPPTGRMLLLSAIDAFVESVSSPLGISANQYPGAIYPEGYHYLRQFSSGATAIWRYKATAFEFERRVLMHQGYNAVTVEYQNCGESTCALTLRPLVCHRDHHGNFGEDNRYPEHLEFLPDATVVEHFNVKLHLTHPNAERMPVQGWYYRFEHARETERGLPSRDDLFCPCELRFMVAPGETVSLSASTEPDFVLTEPASEADGPEYRLSVMLKQAAEAFFVETEERSSIIAGYPWFTDWGRDTMISLPGLCLQTGRIEQARAILRAYSSQMFQGLIPNRFVEQGEHPDYNTVDATLWFANAIYKTLEAEWDDSFARDMVKVLESVYEWHTRGTLFGIGVDPSDGLLYQGVEGVQLTWMDAKVGDWVVTPRRGKPVEINALWINLLRVLEWLTKNLEKGGFESDCVRKSTAYQLEAERAASSFELKFWHENLGRYLDTVDPDDSTLRPNQVIAMALPFSPCDPQHAKSALDVVARELLTPMGLRTLGRDEPGYRGKFSGSLPELDAAYHQGTVWPWLMGSYITSLVRYTQDRRLARQLLRNVKEMLVEYGLGGIAEVYDGDLPQSPGGCPWQAWSVAEMLRAWCEDVQGD